jgi:muramoyltetrapeptide carboxypeptidase LdcA involved in peptidoglycan recycling
VAAVSLSWGGPGEIPHRYEVGKRQLEREFGLSVVEMPHTLKDPKWLAENPQARADDLMQAFSDDRIRGVISTVGGDDSIRLLPYLDLEVFKAHPKVFVGYSDTTVTHLAMFKADVVSFYGPAIMVGFAENGGIDRYLADSFRNVLFSSTVPIPIVANSEGWTNERLEWRVRENQQLRRTLRPVTGWRWLQGVGTVEGPLVGGCLEVLDWLRGTSIWPAPEQWQGVVLLLETSEEAPPPHAVARFFRCLEAQGIVSRLSGVLFGRPGGSLEPEVFAKYDEAVLQVIASELGLSNMPVVSQMDFGHTDPIMTVPYGVRARIDCDLRRVSIIEAGVTD